MDVRSILSDAGGGTSSGLPSSGDKGKPTRPVVKGKKLKGLAREVYDLTGGLPPIVPSQNDMYKAKPKASKVSRWVWKEFHNSARSDGLKLCHWAREDEHEDDYRFSRFNRPVDVPSYTDFEYQTYLSDMAWTKEETDYMINLARDFNLRFPVIADRYNHFGKRRSIEDLKDRYYSIIRKLFRARNTNPSQAELNELKFYEYDKELDMKRRIHLDSLYKKTFEEIEEEEFLLIESMRIQENHKRLMKEREAIMRELSSSVDYTLNTALLATAGKRGSLKETEAASARKKKDAVSTGTEHASSAVVPPSDARRGSQQDAHGYGAIKERLPAGVFTRSSRIVSFRPAVSKQIDKMMLDLDIPTRPSVPTAAVCQKYDDLKMTLARLIEMKKVTDKVQAELNLHHLRQDTSLVRGSARTPIVVPEAIAHATVAGTLMDASALDTTAGATSTTTTRGDTPATQKGQRRPKHVTTAAGRKKAVTQASVDSLPSADDPATPTSLNDPTTTQGVATASAEAPVEASAAGTKSSEAVTKKRKYQRRQSEASVEDMQLMPASALGTGAAPTTATPKKATATPVPKKQKRQ